MKTAVIIQARMNSTRLPGKVLMELGGETVLSQVIKRCKKINNVNLVCCAISEDPHSDLVASEAERCGSVVVRGPEKDVLGRYFVAAQEIGCSVVLRVTSDCPLIDPNVCSEVIKLLEGKNNHFATNNWPRSWPLGLDCEAFSTALLAKAVQNANENEREHVTTWMRVNNKRVKILNYASSDPNLSRLRWTLDTERDYRFLKALFSLIPETDETYSYKLPLQLISETPSLKYFYSV